MADLDTELSSRLARLAAAVPVSTARLDPVHRGAVDARQRVRMAWATPLVAIVAAVVVWSAVATGVLAPGASPIPSPVVATARSGDFELSFRSEKARYAADEPLLLRASLRYLGSDESITIAHGRGSPIGFGVIETVRGVTLDPSWRLSCESTDLTSGASVSRGFVKGVSFASDDPRASEIAMLFREQGLTPGNGVWHPYAVAEFSIGDCGADPIRMRVDLEVVVGDASNSTQHADEDGPATIDEEGDFSLGLVATKPRYEPDEPIEVTGSLLYRGLKPSVELRHDSMGPIMFGIRELVFGEIEVGTMSLLMSEQSTLELGNPLVTPFKKGGGFSGDHPDAEMLRAWMEDPVLRLPEGTYHLYAVASGDVLMGEDVTGSFDLSTEIVIVVSGNPRATPGPVTAEPFRNDPIYGGDDIGWFTLQLKSERARYEVGEPIVLDAWYTASDAGEPSVKVSHFAPEAGYSIEQLDAVNPDSKVKVYDSACTGRTLIPLEERHLQLRPENLMLLKSDPLPARFDGLLRDGTLHLPVGRWRISLDVRGRFGPCEAPGDAYALHASVEIEVVPHQE